MKRKSINRFSLSKIREMQEETPIRIELCKRAGGEPKSTLRTTKVHGHILEYEQITCINGICEICGQPADVLEPHEYKVKRSHGGKVSLDNSKMCHHSCHMNQHSKPMLKWLE